MSIKSLSEYTTQELELGRAVLDSLIKSEKEYAVEIHSDDPEHLEECDCDKVEQFVQFAEYFQEVIDNTIECKEG